MFAMPKNWSNHLQLPCFGLFGTSSSVSLFNFWRLSRLGGLEELFFEDSGLLLRDLSGRTEARLGCP